MKKKKSKFTVLQLYLSILNTSFPVTNKSSYNPNPKNKIKLSTLHPSTVFSCNFPNRILIKPTLVRQF